MSSGFRKHRFSSDITAQANALCQLDNWHGPLAVLQDFLIIGLSIAACYAAGWVLYPLAVIVIGSRQRALATIVHEAAHSTLTQSRTLSRLLGTFFSGYLIFSTLSAYRRSHVSGHHGRFGDRDHDHDYRYMFGKGIYSLENRRQVLIELILRPLLLGNVLSYLIYLVKARSFSASNRVERLDNFVLIAYWGLIVAVSWYAGLLVPLLLFWLVPFLTSFQIIGWFIELAEHGPLMHNGVDLHMTRNRHSHWLELALTGMHGENYHLAHHLRPRVPFWRMAELHQILLRDPEYRQWDAQCGGIFASRNGAPSVVAMLYRRCAT